MGAEALGGQDVFRGDANIVGWVDGDAHTCRDTLKTTKFCALNGGTVRYVNDTSGGLFRRARSRGECGEAQSPRTATRSWSGSGKLPRVAPACPCPPRPPTPGLAQEARAGSAGPAPRAARGSRQEQPFVLDSENFHPAAQVASGPKPQAAPVSAASVAAISLLISRALSTQAARPAAAAPGVSWAARPTTGDADGGARQQGGGARRPRVLRSRPCAHRPCALSRAWPVHSP